MPKQTIFRMTMRSNPRNVTRVEGFLKKVAKSVRMDEIQFHKLMVSLTEAVNNAIIHGNNANPARSVRICCEILPGWILIMVDDQGKGFKPEKVGNPLAKENVLRESGRGIFLMRTLMDKVEFEFGRKGTEVRLWLDLNK
ncbi:MAG: ATP-binding protein [Bacteroidota bacterium]